MKKILIGIDDSKFSEYATAYGFALAEKLDAQVGLVNIIEPVAAVIETTDTGLGMPMENAIDINTPELINIQQQGSETLIERVIKQHGKGREVAHFTEFGATAEGIVDCAKEFNADIIIIGTHSRTGLDRLFMGSVAEHVVRYSPIPVLVVPSPKEDDK